MTGVLELIERKRDGSELSPDEVRCLVRGYTKGEVADYQMAAFLMAAFIRGLTVDETAALAYSIADSGLRLDFSSVPGPIVDKHSTGGVGDKTTLVVAPLAAAMGLKVAKMAGRGLGFTGGTIDKLSSIPGFRVQMGYREFIRLVEEVGIAVTAQTAEIAPADGLLYSLRDVTGTVDHPSLIAASIMGKKIAGGAKYLVLDVKFGSGAFMKTPEEARELAILMSDIGRRAGMNVKAVISNMNQPLGRMVGNSLEVREAIDVLAGRGEEELVELCVTLVTLLAEMAGIGSGEGLRTRIQRLLDGGEALGKFREWVSAQGGDPMIVEEPRLLPCAPLAASVNAEEDGYVAKIDARVVGEVVGSLGAGRKRKEQEIDLTVGIQLVRKVGEKVSRGDPLAFVFAGRREGLDESLLRLRRAIKTSGDPPELSPRVLARI